MFYSVWVSSCPRFCQCFCLLGQSLITRVSMGVLKYRDTGLLFYTFRREAPLWTYLSFTSVIRLIGFLLMGITVFLFIISREPFSIQNFNVIFNWGYLFHSLPLVSLFLFFLPKLLCSFFLINPRKGSGKQIFNIVIFQWNLYLSLICTNLRGQKMYVPKV